MPSFSMPIPDRELEGQTNFKWANFTPTNRPSTSLSNIQITDELTAASSYSPTTIYCMVIVCPNDRMKLVPFNEINHGPAYHWHQSNQIAHERSDQKVSRADDLCSCYSIVGTCGGVGVSCGKKEQRRKADYSLVTSSPPPRRHHLPPHIHILGLQTHSTISSLTAP